VLDLDGILYFKGRTVALSETEEEFLRPLIQRFRKTVPREEIVSALTRERGGMSRNALDLHVLRIRRRLSHLELQLRTVWRRGYLLTISEEHSFSEHKAMNSLHTARSRPGR
jgi:DNA-binding response OmpR family regulator